MKKSKNTEYLKKADVLLTIQNMIRSIQMSDYGKDSGIPQLYRAMDSIADMKGVDISDLQV